MSRFPPNIQRAGVALVTAAAGVTVNAVLVAAPDAGHRIRMWAMTATRLDVAGATTAWHASVTNNVVSEGYLEASGNGHDGHFVEVPGGTPAPENEALRFTWNSNLIGAQGRIRLYYTVEAV